MSEPKVIVIAEDETDAAALLGYQLRKQGYRPVVAPDGLSALNESFEHKPALVLLDVMMPNLDGFQVCRMLKTSPTTRHIPVILLSARTGTEDKLRGFGQGADDYVTKPFHFPELLARIQSLLQRAYDPSRH